MRLGQLSPTGRAIAGRHLLQEGGTETDGCTLSVAQIFLDGQD